MKDGQNGQETAAGMILQYCMRSKRKNGSLFTKNGKEGNLHGNKTGRIYSCPWQLQEVLVKEKQ